MDFDKVVGDIGSLSESFGQLWAITNEWNSKLSLGRVQILIYFVESRIIRYLYEYQ
jgi:hypothetical protein